MFVENKFPKHTVVILRSDNGGEFTSTVVNDFCLQHGIQSKLTNLYNCA